MLVRFRFAGCEPVDQPRRVKAEIVVEDDAERDRRIGRNVAIVLGLVDHHARRFVAEKSRLVADCVAAPEPLRVFQVKPEGKVVFDTQ